MKEYQIVVIRSSKGLLWYTAQVRNVHFLFRGKWRNLYPMFNGNIESAELIIKKDKSLWDKK